MLCVEVQQYTIPGSGGACPEGKPTEYQENYHFAHGVFLVSVFLKNASTKGPVSLMFYQHEVPVFYTETS